MSSASLFAAAPFILLVPMQVPLTLAGISVTVELFIFCLLAEWSLVEEMYRVEGNRENEKEGGEGNRHLVTRNEGGGVAEKTE